jgi:hypothetical protein
MTRRIDRERQREVTRKRPRKLRRRARQRITCKEHQQRRNPVRLTREHRGKESLRTAQGSRCR